MRIAITLIALFAVGCNDTVKVDVHAKKAESAKPKSVQGFICRCGSMCAAKYGGICGGHCGCPIGH